MNGKSYQKHGQLILTDFNTTKRYSVGSVEKKVEDISLRRRLTRQVSLHTLNGFNELRLSSKLCDASLILDNGDTFPIHRSVLSGSSDYFRLIPILILYRIKYRLDWINNHNYREKFSKMCPRLKRINYVKKYFYFR